MSKIHKFFYFEIKGDELNLEDIVKKVSLSGDIFVKGQEIQHYSGLIVQKTNRWAYRDEMLGEISLSKFLTKNLKIICKHLDEFEYFINQYETRMELVVYAGNKTDIKLTKEQINLLHKIGIPFGISFC